MSAVAAPPLPEPEVAPPLDPLPQRIWDNVRTGNLGPAPVVLALAVIVAIFAFTAQNFWSPANFQNIITAMAGPTLIAYGVVFVLLIGEIDLSVAYVSGIAGVVVAQLQRPDGANLTWWVCILAALAATTLIGAFQGSIVALIGVPSFVVTLAGLLIWNGVIFKALPGVITIQNTKINDFSNYLFSPSAGWIMAGIISVLYVGVTLWSALSGVRHGISVRDPIVLLFKVVLVPAVAFVTVWILNKPGSGGVPLGLLLMVGALVVLTFLSKRTTFGRHVYAVGGNAEAARRAGVNVPRIRILVFMIAGLMSGLGGIVLAARLQSVDLQAGSGELLINVIAAGVIGGTSLFGGRGEVRNALIGSALIYTIESGMFILGYATGIIYIVTGIVLLLAATFDTIVRRIQLRSGR
jgi:D-xylose transport system permease protein